jgi:DNA invertase Pin-like site-specific DNA recombinase
MLTVLRGLSESEREPIKARIGEGRMRARERGVHLGRQPARPNKPSYATAIWHREYYSSATGSASLSGSTAVPSIVASLS